MRVPSAARCILLQNAAQQMGGSAQDVAAYTIAAGAVGGVASGVSTVGQSALSAARNPYVLLGAADAALLYGVVKEGVAATWHNDNCRTGWQQQESLLTPATVSATTFGFLWEYTTPGSVDAEPLAVTCNGTCNMVFIADEMDNVSAFDATTNAPAIWTTNLADAVLGNYVDCTNYAQSFPPCEENTPAGNTVGIMGTPVIDEESGLLYAVGSVSLASEVAFYLFAVDYSNGDVVASTQIGGSVPGGNPKSHCTTTYPNGLSGGLMFDSGHIQRAALLFVNHTVYIGFAPGDGETENGWLFGYQYQNSPASLVQTQIFVTTPYGTGGGIWGSSAGPASDGTYIYTVSGNGTFDLATDGNPADWGDSALKLLPRVNNYSPLVVDFYDPPDNLTYKPPPPLNSKGTGRCINDEDSAPGASCFSPKRFITIRTRRTTPVCPSTPIRSQTCT